MPCILRLSLFNIQLKSNKNNEVIKKERRERERERTVLNYKWRSKQKNANLKFIHQRSE